jgi:hypothetical protein
MSLNKTSPWDKVTSELDEITPLKKQRNVTNLLSRELSLRTMSKMGLYRSTDQLEKGVGERLWISRSRITSLRAMVYRLTMPSLRKC